MEEASLTPTADRAIFLLTIPPKSLFHDQHRCVQLQRVVHQSESSGLRIRPIFNLEYHKMFATRVIELEDDDAKVAEFHPLRGHQDEAETGLRLKNNSVRRRSRAFSIEGKSGSLGGNITSQAKHMGLGDMTVVGSEKLGHFTFSLTDDHVYEWRKVSTSEATKWILLNSPPTDTARNSSQASARTSYEFRHRPDRLARTGTSLTLASQYTTHFNNESQLSGLTSSPQADPRDQVSSQDRSDRSNDSEARSRAVLAVSPVPHVKINLLHNSPRHSMHDITKQNDEIYRLLLCVLWITWSSPDFVFEPPETQQQLQANLRASPVEDLTLVDRHSKSGLSKATSDYSFERRRKSKDAGMPTAKASQNKKPGLFSKIAKICGG